MLLPPLLLRSLAAWACCARVPKGLAPAPAPAPNAGAAAPNAVPRGAPNELPPPNPALLPAPNPLPKLMVWRSKLSDSHDGERGGARRRARQGHGFLHVRDSDSSHFHVFLPRFLKRRQDKYMYTFWVEVLLRHEFTKLFTQRRDALFAVISALPTSALLDVQYQHVCMSKSTSKSALQKRERLTA